jgi:SPP1 gp7 family putative phage head morphogenesis protein
MNVPQEILDEIVSRELNLNRFDSDLRKKVVKLLKELESDIIGKLEGKNISNFSKARLQAQLKTIKETITDYYNQASELTTDEYKELAVREADFLRNTVKTITTVDIFSSMPSDNQLQSLVNNTMIQGAPNKEWWSRQSADLYFRFQSAIRMGYGQGESIGQIVARLRDQVAIGQRNAEALVRTGVHSVSSGARELMYEQNKSVIKGKLYTAVLDNRTSIQCIAYDGSFYDMENKPLGKTKLPYRDLPAHWNCRSMYIPVLKSFAELGIKAPDMPKSTRSSMDGQVPEDTTFKDFLERKGVDFQNEVLGKGKAELWRQGKITLPQLLDQSGNPKPLRDL